MSCGKCEMLGPRAPCDECYYRVGPPLPRPAAPELPELPEGWIFDGDETSPGYENKDGDTVEIHGEDITVGIRHAGYKTHYFTELPLSVLRRLLATQGLSIVDAKDRAVLEAVASASLEDSDPDADPLEPQELGEDCYLYTDDQARIVRAELARRAAKEPELSCHGISEGENDKGWPEGTPEEVKRGKQCPA